MGQCNGDIQFLLEKEELQRIVNMINEQLKRKVKYIKINTFTYENHDICDTSEYKN